MYISGDLGIFGVKIYVFALDKFALKGVCMSKVCVVSLSRAIYRPSSSVSLKKGVPFFMAL